MNRLLCGQFPVGDHGSEAHHVEEAILVADAPHSAGDFRAVGDSEDEAIPQESQQREHG